MISTQQLLNKVAFPQPGQNVRRKSTQLYDTISIATATTAYYPFTSSGSIFTNNQVFPLSGSQIFALTNIQMLLPGVINTQAGYEALLTLLQQSYLQIDVDSRTMLKIPAVEVFAYKYQDYFGVSPNQAAAKTSLVNRSKDLILPIVLNSQSNVRVSFVTNSTFTTQYNGTSVRIIFNGIMFDKLDTIAVNFLQNNQYSQLAWTLWESQQVTTTNQNTFNFFSTPNTAPNLFSGTLPLSTTERLEIQALELFVGGNYGTTDNFKDVVDNRSQDVLSVYVEQTLFYQSNLLDILSVATSGTSNFEDAVPTANIGLQTMVTRNQQKVLEIPLIIPAVGNVTVSLQQPGSSLNSNQYLTLMLKGKKVRQVI